MFFFERPNKSGENVAAIRHFLFSRTILCLGNARKGSAGRCKNARQVMAFLILGDALTTPLYFRTMARKANQVCIINVCGKP